VNLKGHYQVNGGKGRKKVRKDESVSIGTGVAGLRWECTSDGSLSGSSDRALSSQLLPLHMQSRPFYFLFFIIFIQKPI